jgi:hypothetical protein
LQVKILPCILSNLYILYFCYLLRYACVKNKINVNPWMSTEILNLTKERDELLLKYRKSNNSEDHKKFCMITIDTFCFCKFFYKLRSNCSKKIIKKISNSFRIVTQFKKNSPLEVGNYRPVSILSIVSKILERSV